MSVSYKQCDGNKVLVNEPGASCFSTIFSGYIQKNCTEIVVYVAPNQLAIPVEMVPEWIRVINQCGFPCKYLGTGGIAKYNIGAQYHNFLVDLSLYKWQNHLCSTLTLLRYMFESGYCGCYAEKGIKAFFEIKQALKNKVTNFRALLMSFAYFASTNHTCHNGKFHRRFITKKQLFDKFPTEGGIYDRKHSNIFSCWTQGKQLNFALPNNYKQLYKLMEGIKRTKVYVVGGANNYAKWLPDTELVKDIKEADIVMFTGGEDVDPSLYGEPMGERTGSNFNRDLKEKKLYQQAKALGLKCIGICRGSQFLCVMNGGKLVQDQPGLGYIHPIETKYGAIEITSTHHQAAFPYNLKPWDYDVIGWTDKKLPYHTDGTGAEMDPPKECEIVYYKNGKDLGIQGHPEYPEYNGNPGMKTLHKIYNDFINNKL